jgi:hypothetical protein
MAHVNEEVTVNTDRPVRFFEMKLRRLGDSDWPGAGAIAPQ